MIRLTIYIGTSVIFFIEMQRIWRESLWEYGYYVCALIFLYLALEEWQKKMVATLILVPKGDEDKVQLEEVQ